MCFCRGLPRDIGQVGAERCDDILACPIGNKPVLREKKKCPAAEQGATCQCAGGDEQQQQRGRCGSSHSLGEYRLIRELNFHTDCLQLYSRQFDCLLSRVGPPFRQPISPTDPYCLVFSEPAALLLDAPRCRHSVLSTPR